MFARLQALLSDPVWWVVTVLFAVVVNLLSEYLYEGLKRWAAFDSARRLSSHVIEKASFDASVEVLLKSPHEYAELKRRHKSAMKHILLTLFMGISTYLPASAEFLWYLEGGNPSLLATGVFFAMATVGTVASLVLWRRENRNRKLLAKAADVMSGRKPPQQ